MILHNDVNKNSLFYYVIGIPVLLILLGLCVLKYLQVSNDKIVKEMAETTERESVADKLERIESLSVVSLHKDLSPEETYQILIRKELSLKATIDNKAYSYNELKQDKDKLIAERSNLTKKLESMRSHSINGVSTIDQYPDYPNGCELVALTILLNYYNIDVSVDDVIDVLPMGRAPYLENGVLYGGNPNLEFLGDPRSLTGWGIWDRGLLAVANGFKAGAINGTGMPFEEIVKLLYRDRPVIVWTSIDLDDPYVLLEWTYPPTGETITWKNYNHAVVVIGYTDDEIIVSDPIDGTVKAFDKAKFIEVYDFMGRRAIFY